MPIKTETVADGEKGADRYRTDKRIKRWLLAKRPSFARKDRNRAANDFVQQVVNYRTEACLAVNLATEAGADADVLDFLRAEHAWALAYLEEHTPAIPALLRGDVVIEYDDAGPDERGRRSFTTTWFDESAGRKRGQCFCTEPGHHIERWRASGRGVTEIETVTSKES